MKSKLLLITSPVHAVKSVHAQIPTEFGNLVGGERESANREAGFVTGDRMKNMKKVNYPWSYTRSALSMGFLCLMTVLASGGQVCYTITDLGTLGGSFSTAIGVNNRGQVVGFSGITNDMNEHAFLYSGHQIQDLGTLGGDESEAYGINNHGQIAGISNLTVNGGFTHAFLYSAGHMQDLGTLGGSFSAANGINNRGQVVGSSGVTGDPAASHAFLYSAGHMQDLGTFGGTQSYASSINDWGQVAGASLPAGDSSSEHAFLYSRHHMEDLGTLGGSLSSATCINNRGQVVGRSSLIASLGPFGPQYAFLYSNGRMINLNSLLPPNSGWTLDDAVGINDAGQIVGVGSHNGLARAFLMTPVP
jgi:probable HAF family extracellular repeat protein